MYTSTRSFGDHTVVTVWAEKFRRWSDVTVPCVVWACGHTTPANNRPSTLCLIKLLRMGLRIANPLAHLDNLHRTSPLTESASYVWSDTFWSWSQHCHEYMHTCSHPTSFLHLRTPLSRRGEVARLSGVLFFMTYLTAHGFTCGFVNGRAALCVRLRARDAVSDPFHTRARPQSWPCMGTVLKALAKGQYALGGVGGSLISFF